MPQVTYRNLFSKYQLVGNDFPEEEMNELKKRGVELSGVEIVPDKKSFFWSGRYHLDMNTRDTLVTDLNVLADFDPESS